MAKSIAITGALRLSDTLRTQIEALGLEVLYIQNELERVDDLYTDVDMVICNGLFLHNDIDRFASLKYIQVTSAGLDRLPMDKIADRSIVLHNARGVYSIPMAEWALSGILSLYKNSFHFTQNKLQKEWCKDRDIIELYAKRALVVGFGSVGVEVTKRLYAMGVSVDAVDKFDVSSEYVNANYLISQLFDIAPRYDIIILTLPLTDETYHLFNGEFFSIVKRGAIVVNISRGAVIDEDALVSAIDSGVLRGAALDVFESEPLPKDSKLWDYDNIIITPHNSFVSERNAERLERVIITNLKRFLDAK